MKTIFHNNAHRKLTPLLMISELVAQTFHRIKTITRRTNGLEEVNKFPENWHKEVLFLEERGAFEFRDKRGFSIDVKSPYGKVGDIIWVKEQYYAFGYWFVKGKTKKTNKDKMLFKDEEIGYFYNKEERGKFYSRILTGRTRETGWYKRSALFMPQRACRLFLEIVSIRPERLQDITEEDAIAEGIESHPTKDGYWKSYDSKRGAWEGYPKCSFESLWVKINGQPSWDFNPWVWRIEFKVIPKPEGF